MPVPVVGELPAAAPPGDTCEPVVAGPVCDFTPPGAPSEFVAPDALGRALSVVPVGELVVPVPVLGAVALPGDCIAGAPGAACPGEPCERVASDALDWASALPTASSAHAEKTAVFILFITISLLDGSTL